MAPCREVRSNPKVIKTWKSLKTWMKSHLKWSELVLLMTDPKKLSIVAGLYLILELIVNILVIQRVPYTEIDWTAYMQEVEGVLNGTFDYSKLRGDTGPLVYPAGFVYVYLILYFVTSHGANIRLAQYIFAFLHLILLFLVFRIYGKTKKVPPYALILICCTSYRIHSIFVLRLFNDPIAMILLYASLNAFLDNHWYIGSVLFSLAVSIKMNVLLYAPVLLIAYLTSLGLHGTIIQICICGMIQFILSLPFLLTNPFTYIKGAFNFGRVFEYKWTVNWRFIPEDIFLNSYFHLLLLSLHLITLLYFTPHWITYLKSYAKLKYIEKDVKDQLRKEEKVNMSTVSQLFILPMFAANFIGIVFSRTLHYQFYIWYYHTLPYIIWCTDMKTVTKFVILGIIELCWNTYPSTVLSSVSLHCCHIVLLYGLYKNKLKTEKSRNVK